MEITDWIVTAEGPACSQARVGGKAANLFFLRRRKLPVPPFFCVSSDAFRAFLSPVRDALQRAWARGRDGSPESLRRASEEMGAALACLPVNETLARVIRENAERLAGAGYCAVRSSALGEDSGERSFAGLFSSFLFVRAPETPASVRACWCRAFDPGLLGYCLHHGLDPLELRLAVIVQEMVPARASGVLFTAHPTGALTETVVVAGYGLGEGVVTDRVETDRYVYDRLAHSFRSEIAFKTRRVDFDDVGRQGTRLCAVDPALADSPVLGAEVLQRLVKMGEAMEQSFGRPQDIEWCTNPDGEIRILQSRPITRLPSGHVTVFDNSNIIESFPGVTLPLTFSIVREGYGKNFHRMVRKVGVSPREVERNRPLFDHLVGSIQGRVYYNLTSWYGMLNVVPGLGRYLVPAFEDMVGIRQREPLSALRLRDRVRDAWRVVSCGFHLTRFFFLMDRHMRKYGRTIDRWWAQERSRGLERMSPHELVSHLRHLDRDVAHVIHVPLVANLLLMVAVALTKRVLRFCGSSDPDGAFNALLCRTGVLASTLPLRSMLALADRLRDDPPLRQALEEALSGSRSPAFPAALLDDPRHRTFRAAFDRHLERYGDRFPEELKLEREGFRERPALLLATILHQATASFRPEQVHARENQVRASAEANISHLLRGKPFRRRLLRGCLERARRFVAHRERARLDRARGAGICRSLARTLGRKLTEEGTLARPEDVFYLTVQELEEFIHGSGLPPSLEFRVRERRLQYEAYGSMNPPDRIVCRGPVGQDRIAQDPGGVPAPLRERVCGAHRCQDRGDDISLPAEVTAQTAGLPDPCATAPPGGVEVLYGTPCCPGTVEAEAVRVSDPSDAPDVSGKIIVARMTDPAWVFLMISAAGLVMEKGSILSHTAIVGRELGIPTVVGVKQATRRIQTGRRVRLDATTGTITLLP